jgi:hypothetical protein
MLSLKSFYVLCLLCVICAAGSGAVCWAQGFERELDGTMVSVKNLSGRVTVIAAAEGEERKKISLKAESAGAAVAELDVKVTKAENGRVEIEVREGRTERDRIDLVLRVPQRARVRVETRGGAVDVSGNLSEVEGLNLHNPL